MPNDKIDFPSNSHKEIKPKIVQKEERKVEKIISGNVVKQKKSLGRKISEMFLGDDSKSVSEYIIHDVLIPSAKDMIADTVKGGIEMLLFGERRGRNTSRDKGKSYVSYSNYYKNDRDRERTDRDRNDISKSARTRHDFDDIILETRSEAEEVLSHLVDLTIDYGVASVADLYDLVGISSNFTDNKYGWTDLRNSNVTHVRGGYLINLPRVQTID